MSWGLGCWIEDQQNQGDFPVGLLELERFVHPLILFKYWDWLGWNINALAAYTGSETTVPTLDCIACWYFIFHLSSSCLCCGCEEEGKSGT